MKRRMSLVIVGLLAMMMSSVAAQANGAATDSRLPKNFVHVSLVVFRPFSFGLHHQVRPSLFLAGHVDYNKQSQDLFVQAGALYLIPRKFWFFRLYGGGGAEFARNRDALYPYFSAGANFWIFYMDVVYGLRRHVEPRYRLGFNMSF